MSLSPLHAVKTPITRELIPIRVLVIDEEALIRWSVCSALATAGFDAIAARSAEEACALAAARPPPQVVILDLPFAVEGSSLIATIRSICPDCRFVLMSTSARRASGSDGDDVRRVQKPFDLTLLVRLVREVLPQEGPS